MAYQLFDNQNLDKVYYYPNGAKITGREFISGDNVRGIKGYEAAATAPYVIDVDESGMISRVAPLAILRANHQIDAILSDTDALQAIVAAQTQQDAEAAAYIDPTERLAAAQEAANMANGMAVSDEVILRNLEKGLFTASTLAKAAEAGVLPAAKVVELAGEASDVLVARGKAALDTTAIAAQIAVVETVNIKGTTKA